MAPPTTRFATHRGQTIAYTASGPDDGECIVLQHGWTGSKDAWTDYVDAFVDHGYRCICVDSLGHGESDKPTQAKLYDRAQRAGDIVAVMDAEHIPKAHFIGYSMGGWIACCMAEFQADRLLSLMIGGHCPGTGTNEEAGASTAGEEYTFDRVLELADFKFPDEVMPAMRHTFDTLEDVAGHEEAVAAAGVPVLLWKGRGEAVICEKGETVAKRNGWDFFAVDGDHVQACVNHQPNVPHLLAFLENVGRR
jgi:pimeloyl-ACP methyl ester carboxylesterase